MTIHAPVAAPAVRPFKRLSPWRFWLPLALQVIIVLAVPAPKVAAFVWGTPIQLSIQPVDPYDLLRGRYVQLGYDLDRLPTLETLPGWKDTLRTGRHDVYVTLVPPGKPDTPWRPTAVANARPATLSPGAVVLKAHLNEGTVDLGLGQYYMNEDVGGEAEAALQKSAGRDARAEVRVDAQGNAVLTGIWIAGKRY